MLRLLKLRSHAALVHIPPTEFTSIESAKERPITKQHSYWYQLSPQQRVYYFARQWIKSSFEKNLNKNLGGVSKTRSLEQSRGKQLKVQDTALGSGHRLGTTINSGGFQLKRREPDGFAFAQDHHIFGDRESETTSQK